MYKSTKILVGTITLIFAFVVLGIFIFKIKTDKIIRDHKEELLRPIPAKVYENLDDDQKKALKKYGMPNKITYTPKTNH